MKFVGNWSVDQDKWSSMRPEERADAGEGIEIVGRWRDLGSRTGVAIMEAVDAAALQLYLDQWNPHMDIAVSPVLDDEKSARTAKAIVESQG